MFSRKRYRTKIRVTGLILLCLCTLTLGYAGLVQDISIEGTVEGVTTFKLNSIVDSGLASGDLVSEKSTTYSARGLQTQYYYRGLDPNNHLIFANKCFRIVNMTTDGHVKIIYDGNVSSNGTCDTVTVDSGLINNTYRYNLHNNSVESSVNNWFDDSNDSITIRKSLESLIATGNVGGILLSNSNLNSIASATWYVGAVEKNSAQTINEDLENEKYNQGSTALPSLSELGLDSYSYTGKVGLLNVTDYVRASSNTNCTSVYSGTADGNYCGVNNYLAKNYKMIFMNPVSNTNNKIWSVNERGILTDNLVYEEVYIRPVFYLVPGLNYAGEGTVSNPYVII